MTRINCIDINLLHPKHLSGEYAEITRPFNLVRAYHKRKQKGLKVQPIPEQYTLGTGHVLFFYDKLQYIVKRYNTIIDLLESHGWDLDYDKINAILKAAEDIPKEYFNDWQPTRQDKVTNILRLIDRTPEGSPNFYTRKQPSITPHWSDLNAGLQMELKEAA